MDVDYLKKTRTGFTNEEKKNLIEFHNSAISIRRQCELLGIPKSVMCYNLYGNGTEAGPKADAEFLKEIAAKFGSLPGISFALANGGFDFDGTGKAK